MTDTPWPADAVHRRLIGDLVPYARNSRTHSDAQVAKIAASMLEFGWTNAVLVDEHDNIIAGHGRIMAASSLIDAGHGRFAEAPVMTAIGWSEAQKRAYVIADNKLALDAGWDTEMLALELSELMNEGDIDIAFTGFDQSEIDALLPTEVGDLDPVPENPPEQPGDMHPTLKFDGKSIPLTADEIDRLNDAVAQYQADRGGLYGFVGALLDAATAGNF